MTRLTPELVALRHWLGIAVGVLLLAGVFALVLVAGRMPPFDRFVTDPLFFRRALVVHVDLALVCWFASFVAALGFLLPGKGRSGAVSRATPFVAVVGIAMMAAATAIPGTTPVLSNYVPVIDHPLFGAGLLTFGLAVVGSVLDRRLDPRSDDHPGPVLVPVAARVGLRAAAFTILLAAAVLAASLFTRPVGHDVQTSYELLVWGVGHVLQLVSTIGMVTVWLVLLAPVVRHPIASRPVAATLFGVLLIPWGFGPALAILGTTSNAYHEGFTWLMRWGIFPVVGAFFALCVQALLRARRQGVIDASAWRDPRVAGFLVSAGLTLLGYVLGALIRGPDTMVPAHYHAAIGGVTVAYMAGTFVLFGALGLAAPPRQARLAALQPALFGVGQMVFAVGFAVAGAHGMERKVYGAEQASRTLPETVGLVVMGLGGLVAAAGGLLFLFLVLAAVRRALATRPLSGGLHGATRSAEGPPVATVAGQPLGAAGARHRHPLPVVHGVGVARDRHRLAGDAAVGEVADVDPQPAK